MAPRVVVDIDFAHPCCVVNNFFIALLCVETTPGEADGGGFRHYVLSETSGAPSAEKPLVDLGTYRYDFARDYKLAA